MRVDFGKTVFNFKSFTRQASINRICFDKFHAVRTLLCIVITIFEVGQGVCRNLYDVA